MRAVFLLMPLLLAAAEPPQAELSNGSLRVKVYLPDAANGFYRATRFDWSGMIETVEYGGHKFYGRWFQGTDPAVHDFEYRGADIVAGPNTAATGPAEEFNTNNKGLGFDDAKTGGTFLKIGVGVLRRPDDRDYDHFRLYDIVDPGKWTNRMARDSAEFTQAVNDAASGYGYEYRKTVRLVGNGAEMEIAHSFRNTGKKPISSRVYNHNFLVIDGQAPGPDFTISVPFEIRSQRPPDADLAEIRGTQILYRKTLDGRDRVMTQMEGFGAAPSDYDVKVINTKTGAGVRVTADRPLASLALWSIRAVMSVEPFVEFSVKPGETYTWTLRYRYLK
ncbi:MAG TPA: hypothetical protein VMH28_11630 [Candidatus Acidoferrales bacterium]|nr:hypothetical protein [Candidatus Acidoferrales bacterium]